MNADNERVCPVERAGHLNNWFRRWTQNPRRILRPYIVDGMTVLDVGCGPGFFTIDMAEMVGEAGHVVATDLQEGMLQIVRDRIQDTELESRITLHQCAEDRIGVTRSVDFILAFYMVHEVPSQTALFTELGSILQPDGRILVVEPPFHVSKAAFNEMVGIARQAGLECIERPRVLFSKTAVLKKC